MKATLKDVQIITVPKVTDPRGNIAIIEKDILPYDIKRVYYLFDVPSDSIRGGHAHIQLKQCLIALSGSFNVVLDDGQTKKKIHLNKPDKALLIPNGIWRELEDFSSGSVCLALVNEEYSEEDYIRNYDSFMLLKNSKLKT